MTWRPRARPISPERWSASRPRPLRRPFGREPHPAQALRALRPRRAPGRNRRRPRHGGQHQGTTDRVGRRCHQLAARLRRVHPDRWGGLLLCRPTHRRWPRGRGGERHHPCGPAAGSFCDPGARSGATCSAGCCARGGRGPTALERVSDYLRFQTELAGIGDVDLILLGDTRLVEAGTSCPHDGVNGEAAGPASLVRPPGCTASSLGMSSSKPAVAARCSGSGRPLEPGSWISGASCGRRIRLQICRLGT